ncbi:putative IS1414 transposase (plasmid) [Klebsiella pneumoniae subsp. pneumoniae DSM 30104 = JCM 1662 = NBRC 14940]|nr:putative IS1414 transposase [Klebsiella pneumoniae subsp. pneumoniae DSM 30104 = JCM 1662 = NBRC 14940]
MTHHLGYEKNQSRPGANSRNGYSTKSGNYTNLCTGSIV